MKLSRCTTRRAAAAGDVAQGYDALALVLQRSRPTMSTVVSRCSSPTAVSVARRERRHPDRGTRTQQVRRLGVPGRRGPAHRGRARRRGAGVRTFVIGVPGPTAPASSRGCLRAPPYNMLLALSTYAVSGSPETVESDLRQDRDFLPKPGAAPAKPCHVDLSKNGMLRSQHVGAGDRRGGGGGGGKALGCVYDLPAPPKGESIESSSKVKSRRHDRRRHQCAEEAIRRERRLRHRRVLGLRRGRPDPAARCDVRRPRDRDVAPDCAPRRRLSHRREEIKTPAQFPLLPAPANVLLILVRPERSTSISSRRRTSNCARTTQGRRRGNITKR